MTVLLQARCANGHEWDVYGEELGNAEEEAAIPVESLRCPTCFPERVAVQVRAPESLA